MTVPKVVLWEATQDEQDAYAIGHAIATKKARVEAFSAIRRALEVARRHERESRIQGDYPCGIEHAQRGDAVRKAIRIAVGSRPQVFPERKLL